MKYSTPTLVLCALGLFQATGLMAQQDPHFTMYMFNKQAINPAYVGSMGTTSFQALYRSQWVGIEGAPKTVSLTAQGLVGRDDRIGLGVHLLNDRIGVDNHTGLYAQYAYHLPLSDNIVTSLGLQAGVTQYISNLSQLKKPIWTYPGGDDVVANDVSSAWLPNVGLGAYMWSEKFYAGMSVPHLISNYYDKDREDSEANSARQYKHYFLFAGMKFNINDDFAIQPQFLMKYANGRNITVPMSADLSTAFIFRNIVMLGATYRIDESVDIFLRAQITKNFNIGYAYDHTLSPLVRHTSGSHEMVLGWEIGEKVAKFVGPRLWTF